jgi:hypothetical protein
MSDLMADGRTHPSDSNAAVADPLGGKGIAARAGAQNQLALDHVKRDGMSLGLQLRRARSGAGLSLRDVAQRTGGTLSPGALSLIETGKRYPSLRTLETLARVLNLVITVSAERVSTEEARWHIRRRSRS